MTSSIGRATDSLPEQRSATLDHHLRQDATKAVAHDDHSVEGRVRAGGITDSTRSPQGLPQQVGRVEDRVPTRVAIGPELIPCSECGVGLEILNHPVPVPRAAPETMNKHDRDLAPLIRPERKKPARIMSRSSSTGHRAVVRSELITTAGRISGRTE